MVEKKQNNGVWKYYWTAGGMLKAVQRPDGSVITFKYDAFGRRIEKKTARATTHFVWDGNVPLHEWKTFDYRETTDNDYITWVFQDFVPVAKLQGDKSYSIISDHIGTPLVAIDNDGVKVWERELDIYGKVRKETKENPNFVPFRYQGQYYDSEVDLCYNRFRYYDCKTGSYISQDPIGLEGGNPTLYGYVFDSNTWIDEFGLLTYNTMSSIPNYQKHHIIPQQLKEHSVIKNSGMNIHEVNNIIYLPKIKGIDPNPNLAIHNGSHPIYTEKVLADLDEIKRRADNDKNNNKIWTEGDYKNEIDKKIEKYKKMLQNGKIQCK
ncbi:hypothetical protein CAPN006_18740 [Capnocytophaga canimorsus]|uniref:RHS repeat-associated core domain-containing protein n=1 Tax=Capnocytophaga canimorsus TaxID=28188 RepID=UPI001ACB8799|nr:RHS repeat-associated core domain-containing protein [Capnocytophaga canimorsus]GIM57482.1 hypothetical protein CAPN006_18740 [Capnocytophaga canimorsus]